MDENIRERKKSISNRELIVAASEGDFEQVKHLIEEARAEVNFVDRSGRTALHYAVEKGSEKVVDYLLEKGADINIEDTNNINPLDIAVSSRKENITRMLGRKVVDKSIGVIEKYFSPIRIRSPCPTEPSTSLEERSLCEEQKKITERNINALSKRLQALTLNDRELSYEQANVFILFLEIFALQNVSNKKVKSYVQKHFLKDDATGRKIAQNTRNLILKSKNIDMDLSDITTIIEQCYVNESAEVTDQSKVQHFFHDLKEYVKNKTEISYVSQGSTKKISSFFKAFPNNPARGQLGDATDPFDKFKDLVLEAYRKGRNLEQQWFNFVVNIYPTLEIPGADKEVSAVERQIRHVRTNVIHAFYRYGIQEFREAMVNIRGKLIEFYYAKKVHNSFKSLSPGGDNNVEENCLACLSTLQCNFEYSGELSSEAEAKSLFGFKFVRSLFAKQSSNTDNSAVKSVVEQYFKYMSLIEDENRVSPYDDDDDRAETENSASDKELSDVARREVFEKFVRLSRIKENCSDEVYTEEKEKLFANLEQYRVEKTKFNSVCKHFLKEGNHFNEDVSEVIENVVKFIEGIRQIKESDSDYKEKEIFSLGELILNKDNVDKKLVLGDNSNLHILKEKAEKDRKITQLFDRADSFNDMCIQIDNICLNINVRQAIKNMLKTFYNAYNEYRIVFDIKDIFSRHTFLNELVWQNEKEKITDSQVFIIVYKLIDIEYMSPYIVKLIENKINKGSETSQIIDNKNLVKLIDNLLMKDEYVEYLDILLKKIEVNSSFNPYEIILNRILVKKADLKIINSIFKEFVHLQQFADLLIDDLPKYYDNKQKLNNLLELTKSFVKTINEEAAHRLYYTSNYNEALKILEKGEEMQVRLHQNKNATESSYPDFIDRELLVVRIKNRQGEYREALEILMEVKHKLESDTCISHKDKYLLTLSDIVYTKQLLQQYSENSYSSVYKEVLKYVLDLDDISVRFDVLQTIKEKYNKIKNLGRYKTLLSTSDLLHTEKYLDILRIASDSAYQMIKLSDEEGKTYALKITEEIYACYKKDLGDENRRTLQIVRYIANMCSTLGDIYKARTQFSNALSHYFRALIKYNKVHRVREKTLGPNHNAVIDGRRTITHVMRNIAFSFNNLVSNKNLSEREKALQNYNEALKIYEKVYAYQQNLGRGHEHTLSTLADIAYTHNKYALAKNCELNVLPETLHHYTVALEIYGKLKEKTWKRTEEMKKRYEKTKEWKDRCEQLMIYFNYRSYNMVYNYAGTERRCSTPNQFMLSRSGYFSSKTWDKN